MSFFLHVGTSHPGVWEWTLLQINAVVGVINQCATWPTVEQFQWRHGTQQASLFRGSAVIPARGGAC